MAAIMEKLVGVAALQHGYVTTTDAVAVQVNPAELRKLAGRGRLDHCGHGLYRIASYPMRNHDELMAAVMWTNKRAVIGGESALDLHELCDVNPWTISLVTEAPYRPRKHGGQWYRVKHTDLSPGDVQEVDDIPVLVPRRAILDAIEDGVDHRHIEQAIETARRRTNISEQLATHLLSLI